MSETSILANEPNQQYKLSTGDYVFIKRLKTIELFKLLKIISRGGASMLAEYRLDGDLSEDEFIGRMLALVVFSIPEADAEAIEFIQAMVEPAHLVPHARTKDDKERNEALWSSLAAAVTNPEIEDTLTIIEAIIKMEAPHIQSLGKRVAVMWKMAFPEKTPEAAEPQSTPEKTPDLPLSTPQESPVVSQPLSTSSPMSTAGQMNTSLTEALPV